MPDCAYLSCFPELRGSPVVPPSGGGTHLEDSCQESLMFLWVFFFIHRLSSIKPKSTSVKSAQCEPQTRLREPARLPEARSASAAITSRDLQQTPPDYSPIHSRFARPVISPVISSQLLPQFASLLCRSSSLRSHLLERKEKRRMCSG